MNILYYTVLYAVQMISKTKVFFFITRAGHSLLFTLFANRYSATSMYHFAIATPLLFGILQYAIRYSLLPLTSLMGFIVVDFLN
jgi:hypothetical protein